MADETETTIENTEEPENEAGEEALDTVSLRKGNNTRFKGDKNVTIEELPGMPAKVRAFAKSKKIPVEKEFLCKVFRLIKEPGNYKADREFCGAHRNAFIEEPELKENYGGGEYMCYYTWKTDDNGSERGFYSDTYRIAGKPKYPGEGKPDASELRPDSPASAPPLPSRSSESEFDKLKKMAEILNLMKGKDNAADLMDRVMEKQMNSLDKFIGKIRDMSLDHAERMITMTNRQAGIEQEEEQEEVEEEQGSRWPEWLAPFGPLIQRWASKLLGDSPEAVGLRALVQGSDVFRKRWSDPKKREEAISAMNKNLGKELAEGLVNIFNHEIGE